MNQNTPNKYRVLKDNSVAMQAREKKEMGGEAVAIAPSRRAITAISVFSRKRKGGGESREGRGWATIAHKARNTERC